MLKSGLGICSSVLAVAFLLEGAACAEESKHLGLVTFDIRTGGDDGLTQRFANALEVEFQRSGSFILSKNGEPVDIVVTIPSSLKWRAVGPRERVTYVAKFSGGGRSSFW